MEDRLLQRLLSKVRKELSWPVMEQSYRMPVIRVLSYPHTRSHLILTPEKSGSQYSDAGYLHELGHAMLCERVHPVFSANASFAPDDDKRRFLVLVPALSVACDWFVTGWQMTVASELTLQQIGASVAVAGEILSQAPLPPLEIILDAALVVAQAIHYLDEPVDCQGVLQPAVAAFLAVAPERPSADACVYLVNRLMATYTHQRARLTQREGLFVWEVETGGAEAGRAAKPGGDLAGSA